MKIITIIAEEIACYAISHGVKVSAETIETRLTIASRCDDNYLKLLYRNNALNYNQIIGEGVN